MISEDDFLSAQTPINQALANAMISATPEYWDSIKLEIELDKQGYDISMKHVISSPEGYENAIMLTNEIAKATYRLSKLFESNNKAWKKAVFIAAKNDEGKWVMDCQYEY